MTEFVEIDGQAYPLNTPDAEDAARAKMLGRWDHLPIWESRHDAEWLRIHGNDPEARATGGQFHAMTPES